VQGFPLGKRERKKVDLAKPIGRGEFKRGKILHLPITREGFLNAVSLTKLHKADEQDFYGKKR